MDAPDVRMVGAVEEIRPQDRPPGPAETPPGATPNDHDLVAPHPFTAPALKPVISHFWMKANTRTTGTA
ncbi:MAG: hypothetical protein HOQ47_23985, partial [Streptomyces sp.]|nr:hypothetical protein [Streptomyces sp.]